MKYKAVVFDVDGTLLNTEEGVLASVRYAIEHCGLPVLSDDILKTFIGPPVQNSLIRVYGLEPERAQEVTQVFRERYKKEDLLKAVPYEGIYEVFDRLRTEGIRLAVATYKRQDYARRIMEFFKFDQYTEIVYGADDRNRLKKKDIIEKCMIDMGLKEYSSAVMIGDSDNDAIGAEELGMDFIGVTYGFGFHKKEDVQKFRAAGCAEKTTDIIRIIMEE